ncbi:hypothetical protein DFH06DRAFT_715696 [Mycena polygramma]|nr:hypothetical protein DFH06DRAFT_715696 [Mycena polygramma]
MSALSAPFFSILPLSFLRPCDAAAITNSSIVDEQVVDRALSISLVYGLVLFYVAVVVFFIVRHVRRGLWLERGIVATVANGNRGQGGDYPLSLAVSGPSPSKEDAIHNQYTTFSGMNPRSDSAGPKVTASQDVARQWRGTVGMEDPNVKNTKPADSPPPHAEDAILDAFVVPSRPDDINGDWHTIQSADMEVRSLADTPEAPSSLSPLTEPIDGSRSSPPEVGGAPPSDTAAPDTDDVEGDPQITQYTDPASDTSAPEAPGSANHERQSPDTTDTNPGSHFPSPVVFKDPPSHTALLDSDTASKDSKTALHAAAPEPADAPTEDGNLAERNVDDQAEGDGGSLSSNADTRDLRSSSPDAPYAHNSTPTDSKRSSRSDDGIHSNTALPDALFMHSSTPIDSKRSSRSDDVTQPNTALSDAPFTHSSTRTDSKRSSRSEDGTQPKTASQDSKIASRVATPEPVPPSEPSTQSEPLRKDDNPNHTDDDEAFLSSKKDTCESSPSRSPSVAPSEPPWENGNPDGGNGAPNYTEDCEASLSSETDLSESSTSGTDISPTTLSSPSDVSESGPSAVHSSRSSDANVPAASQEHTQLQKDTNAEDSKGEYTDEYTASLSSNEKNTCETRSSRSDTSQANVVETTSLSDTSSRTPSSPSDIDDSQSSRGEHSSPDRSRFSHSSRLNDVDEDGHTIRSAYADAALPNSDGVNIDQREMHSPLSTRSSINHPPVEFAAPQTPNSPSLSADSAADGSLTGVSEGIFLPSNGLQGLQPSKVVKQATNSPLYSRFLTSDTVPEGTRRYPRPPFSRSYPRALLGSREPTRSSNSGGLNINRPTNGSHFGSSNAAMREPAEPYRSLPKGDHMAQTDVVGRATLPSDIGTDAHESPLLRAHTNTAAFETGVDEDVDPPADAEVPPGSPPSQVPESKANNKIQSPPAFIGTSASSDTGLGHVNGDRSPRSQKPPKEYVWKHPFLFPLCRKWVRRRFKASRKPMK